IVSMLTLVVGIVFYTTFEPPLMSVFLPELEAFRSWKVVSMVLGAVFISVVTVNYFAKKKKWWGFILIATLILAIILEIVLTILLIKNSDYIANSSLLLVLSFFVVALYIAILSNLLIQNRVRHIKKINIIRRDLKDG